MRLGALVSLEEAAAHGITAAAQRIELGMEEHELAFVRQRFEQAGVWAVQTGGYRNLAATDETVRQEAVAYLRKMLVKADQAGVMFVVTGGGHRDPARPSDVFSAHPDNWRPEALEVLADSCRRVLADLELRQAKLVVETWTMTPVDSPEKARALYEAVNHPHFGILFDPVNLMNLERYFRTGSFVQECVDILGDAIALVHLKDALLRPEAFTYHMSEVMIGEGNVDYPSLLQALSGLTHANVPIMVEHLKSIEAYAASVRHVREIAAANGVALD